MAKTTAAIRRQPNQLKPAINPGGRPVTPSGPHPRLLRKSKPTRKKQWQSGGRLKREKRLYRCPFRPELTVYKLDSPHASVVHAGLLKALHSGASHLGFACTLG